MQPEFQHFITKLQTFAFIVSCVRGVSYFNSSKSFLQISERTDSHIENLHRSLTLWDGVLQLGAEVESWTTNKLTAFAQSPSFQTEEDVRALQVKLHVSLCDSHVQIWSGPSYEKLNDL